MLHPQILQFLIILIAYIARKGYYEIYRPKITNVRILNYGDQLVAVASAVLGIWALGETWATYELGMDLPSLWLVKSLTTWFWICAAFPLLMLVINRWLKLKLSDFFIGLGRGCLTFGVPIALLPLLCWFPR
ncbi:hypothetical protein IQ266_11245 [filamentous cyanobacterium LEGE 11480]|uniref:Uncharacterized protein n=1 Tax=Romeriopsis navalis LEGE 11480 TaxID=2777977 RepID=A0A928VPT6_9CYAN|nr:hypothetical protein [Romeriopsis navalis]MBE9030307.1 hypothetical protein [Romeriopsis navalis LEGE 11480]